MIESTSMAPTEGVDRIGQVTGVSVGTVTDNVDPENLGRVKVQFSWLEDGEDTSWARIAVPMAGKDRGLFTLPEVGDEVLCAFDGGLLEHTYVVGALWSTVDPPPRTEVDSKVFKSRSGHEWIVEDKSPGKVEFKTANGHHVLLDEAGTVEISDGGSNRLTIDVTSGGIELRSDSSMKLSSQTIAIEAGTQLSLESGGQLSIQGSIVQIN